MLGFKLPFKGGKKEGGVYALLVVLFIIGGGAAYLVFSGKLGSGEERDPKKDQKPPQKKVVETRSLVEAPPPLPEDTPVLPVTEAVTSAEGSGAKGSSKKGAGLTGTMDPKVVKNFIESRTAKVRACYEKELKVNNLLMGTVSTSIIVNPDGSVDSIRFLSDSVRSPSMRKCIEKEIGSWTFPKPRGGKVEVRFPFRFEPKEK